MKDPAPCPGGGPHDFAPDEAPAYRCSRCEFRLHYIPAGWYELGLEDGRRDAWARPPRPQSPRWAVAALLAFGAALVGASPTEALPEPPPDGPVEALRDCLAAAEQLEADLERAWKKTANPAVVDESRAPVRAAAQAASSARGSLAYALADALPCAAQRVPGCAAHAAPLVSARGAEAARATKALRQQVDNARLAAP